MNLPALYLDTCCLSRLTDDLSQPRLVEEAQAVVSIFTLIQSEQVHWVASIFLAEEIALNPDPYKRIFAESLLPPLGHLITPNASILATAANLSRQGLKRFDALHLAVAIQGGAEWFLTTDDRLLRRTANRKQPPQTVNPVDWLRRRYPWLVPRRS